jgi:hypothetical protein
MNINTTRLFSHSIVAAGFLGLSSLSHAALLTWEDIDSGSPLDFLYESTNSRSSSDLFYTATWNLLTKGYTANSPIDAITVWFKFADDSSSDVTEHVDISVGGSKIWDDLEVDGIHPSPTYATYSLTLNPVTHMSIFDDLKVDGLLTYTVELQRLLSNSCGREDTYLKEAGLQATYAETSRTNRVPDGGTSLALLGMSLAGIAGLRKKLN